jgi:hypothetical protein
MTPVPSAENSQIFRALRSPRVICGRNMIRAQSHCRSFPATCRIFVAGRVFEISAKTLVQAEGKSQWLNKER